MIDPIEFYKVMSSRDIRKVIRWLEREYRKVVVPLVKKNSWLSLIEEPAGQKVGELLGSYFVQRYEACSPEERQEWDANRWLHHGAVGELIVHREKGKPRAFLVGLGKGLMISDLQDLNEWHTPEYWEARRSLDEMR
jgi:hypothetical protein